MKAPRSFSGRLVARYAVAVPTVGVAILAWQTLVGLVGALPHYITLYPAVMLTAIFAGMGPGLLATGLGALMAAYWILPPQNTLLPISLNDAIGLGLFSGMGAFMTLVVDFFRRYRQRAAVYEKELAVREEQARAAVETERQRQLLAVTLTSIGDGVIVTDVHGRVTFLNGEAERLTGWSSSEATGRPLAEVFKIVNAYTRQAVENPVDKVLHLGATVALADRTVLIARDGREIPIDDSGAPVRFSDGAVHGVVLVFRDFTERKRREALLHTRLRLSEVAQHASIDELIRSALDEAEALTNSCIGYFHLVDEDQQSLTLQAWSTNTLSKMCRAEGKGRHYPISQAGVWVDCLHARAAVIHNDYASLAHKKGLPEGHVPIVRDLGVPVLRGDRVIAVIGVGNKATDYTQDDVEVLQSLAVPLMDLVGYKRAEEALRESEERRKVAEAVQAERQRFNDVLEMLPAYVVLLTPDYHVPFANRFFEQRFGKSDGQRCFEYLFHRGEPCENCETYKVLKTGVPHHWEWTGPDGRHYDIHDFPFTDADGSPLIMEMGIDITERKRAEAALQEANETLEQRVAGRTAALRESEARYRSYIEVTLQVGWTTNADGEVVEDMPAWRKFTGQTLEEIQGWGWAKALHPDDVERTSAIWRQAVAGKQNYETEYRLRRHDGVYRHFLARGVPAFHDDGSVREWVGTCIDITDRKAAEEALVQAKAAAEAANEAKGRFLANISHELRTPMNAILGMVDLALPKQVDPTATDFLKTARGSADLLLTLLNDLLDSAKIEAGRLELESAPFSLRRILDQTTQVLAVRASEKGVSFSCRIAPDVPDALVGDQMRLRQIFLNLAGNGIKFTERGEVMVRVEADGLGMGDQGLESGYRSQTPDAQSLIPDPQSPIPAATLRFSVADTGIGIPRSDLEHIFRPFAQADPSTARQFGGTGLGLTICASLVGMMGGRIWVESEPGRGSTFYFTVRLPLTKELPPEPDAFNLLAAATSRLRILLVEDNPANQKLAAYILQERGHTVDIAADGQEALRMTQENCHDVILMDVQMPGMDGLEVTKAIRARKDGNRRVPIVAMTAHAMKGDRERCLAAGMDGYLSKPIDGQEMIALVESLTAASADGGTPPPASPPEPVEPAQAPAAVVFDPDLALKRCFNSRDMLADMIQCFFGEVDSLFPQMRAALQRGDLVEVGCLGHRLKGTVVYLGAERAREAALRVERFEQHGGQQAEAEEAIRALEQQCAVLKAVLLAHRAATVP